MDISRWVRHRADCSPDRVAVHFAGADITYAALDRRVSRLAAALAGGLQIRPGDRVAYLGYNSPVVLELLFACARLGAIFVPLNWRLTAPEHRFVLGDAEPSALFAEPDFHARAEEAARRGASPGGLRAPGRARWLAPLRGADRGRARRRSAGAVTSHRRSSSSTRRARPGGRKAPC